MTLAHIARFPIISGLLLALAGIAGAAPAADAAAPEEPDAAAPKKETIQ